MIARKYSFALSTTFLWIGFVCTISFMEAWLKFRAPGVTMPIGLAIGRIIFSALNTVEWVFAFVIISNLLLTKKQIFTFQNTLFFIPLAILVLQTIWVLPALDARAELHIQKMPVSASNLHFYYVGMEIVKVVCLALFGTKLLNKN